MSAILLVTFLLRRPTKHGFSWLRRFLIQETHGIGKPLAVARSVHDENPAHQERAIVGIVEVIAEAHLDSTDSAWCAVDVAAVEPLPTAVGRERIKADKRLAGMALARLPRLSVQPVTDAEWRLVCQMGGLVRA